jgi:hypothetical protein
MIHNRPIPSLRPATSLLVAVLGLLGVVSAPAQTNGVPPPPMHRFERNVAAYEAADRTNPPPLDAILLVGDSQFFRWKTLAQDLPGYTIIDRGIDSFELSDLNYFFDRLVAPYHPRLIVMNVGGNDVHNGKSPEQILADFKTFVARARAVYPAVPIAFSSTTPGPARWPEAPRREATNRLLKEYIASQPGLLFIDLWDAMLTPDGQPREDLWVTDRIHSNHAGYLIRVKIMEPVLGALDKSSAH